MESNSDAENSDSSTDTESNSDAENSDSSTDMLVHNMTMLLKMLKLLKQMQEMQGPQDSIGTGELVSAGGHGSEKTPSDGSPHTPPDLAADPTPPQNRGQSLKRPIREYTVDSPIKKKSSKTPSYDDCLSAYHTLIKEVRERKRKESEYADKVATTVPVRQYTVDSPIKKKSSKKPSYDDCLSAYHTYIKEVRERKRKKSEQADKEAATVTQLLREDGYCKSDLFFHQAMLLCTDKAQRKNFLQMTSAEGRYKYVQIALEALNLKHWHPK